MQKSSNNSAIHGGGIYNQGTLAVINSSISNNRANEYGGGIYCKSNKVLTVSNSTIASNWAGNEGGGIYCSDSSSVQILNNTIVAGNKSTDGPDIYGSLSGSSNLIGDGTGQSDLVNGVNGNQVGTSTSPIDPMLSDWTQLNNGLWGHYLLPGSPALDAGDNALTVDSEGLPLSEDLEGNNRIQNGTVDMGAVEGAIAGGPAQTYTVTSLEETVGNDGILTFLEAFEAASRNQPVGDALAGSFSQQDTILFADGLSGTIFVDDGELSIFGDLNIEGPGVDSLTFQAGGQNRVFNIWPNVSVRLVGMKITGGSADQGGGIKNSGTLTIMDSELLSNSADVGGGIYNAGTMTVMQSTLSGNSARLGGDGGGIYSIGTLTVSNSTLSNNSAGSKGGGIYNNENGDILTVTNSLLSGNSARSGGGIYNTDIAMTVSNSSLSDNLAVSYGGGIYNSSGVLTVTSSTITGNSSSNLWGGGIYNEGTLSVDNSTITVNTAFVGGGIYNAGTLTVSNSTLPGNSADYDGGGICTSGTLTVTNCSFSDNSANNNGGGIYSSGTLTVTNSSLSGNSADYYGGGIYNDDMLAITGSVLSDNSAKYGGGIYHRSDILTIICSILSDNSASTSGGAIYTSDPLAIANSTLSDNSASQNGGGIYHDDEPLTILNSTLSGNSAKYGGGGIFNDSDTIQVTNSTITGNIAYNNGGGILVKDQAILNNVLVAANWSTSGSDIRHISGSLSGSHNLISNGSGQSSLVDGVDNNQVGTTTSPIDPMLGNWAQFGNGQWGYILLPDSPALNRGDNALAVDAGGNLLVTDQAGRPRIIYGTVDIGASEYWLSGDFNPDGNVASDDLNYWKSGFGTITGANLDGGEADGDGDVDGNDFLIWQQNFGSSMLSGSSAASPAGLGATGTGNVLPSFLGIPDALSKSSNISTGGKMALIRSSIRESQASSLLPTNHQSLSPESVSDAEWSLPQSVFKTSDSPISWLDPPSFQSFGNTRRVPGVRAIDAVMSGLDERSIRSDLKRVYRKHDES